MSAQKRNRDLDEEEEFSEEDTKPSKPAAPSSGTKKAKTSNAPPTGDAVFSIGREASILVKTLYS